jgi:predicted RNase H-like HicB family nuclease
MKYRVALQKTDDGFAVSCPGLPGCWSQGRTEEEALANIREAIVEYLAVAEEIAEQTGEVRDVDVST